MWTMQPKTIGESALMAKKLIRSSVMVVAVSVLAGIAGCSCHKSACYDGDCGLVYDNDYWEGDCGGCGAPSGHEHGTSCGGCGAPVAHSGCSHPHGVSGGCSEPHHHQGPTCSSCGGVHTTPSPVVEQPGCPHCGVQHGPAAVGAPPAEPAQTTATPPPPPLPPTIPATPSDKAVPAKPPVVPMGGAAEQPVTGQVPPPLQTIPVGDNGGLEPGPPTQPVEVPLPILEQPAPLPRGAEQPKWIPRRL